VVVPEGLLFGSTLAHTELRRKLVEDYDLQAVVSLPAGVFKPYAGVKTAVVVFRRPASEAKKDKKAHQKDKVWFYEVRIDGYDPDKIQGGGRPETPDRNDIPDLLNQWAEFRKSGFTKPPGVEASTVLEPGSEEPRCWWSTIAAVKANDYNLAAGRYTVRSASAGWGRILWKEDELGGDKWAVILLGVGPSRPSDPDEYESLMVRGTGDNVREVWDYVRLHGNPV
ncbi:MAG TPA: N-6 DNA methylase, partial [Phycisphaerae bacterium]|nr:N-6 DNA methylase [Phycisphaerae bacterium]